MPTKDDYEPEYYILPSPNEKGERAFLAHITVGDSEYRVPCVNLLDGSIEITQDGTEMLKELGVCFPPPPSKYSISYVCLSQKKSHRKKRINKKWAKRYGYQIVRKPGVEIHVGADGYYDFIMGE